MNNFQIKKELLRIGLTEQESERMSEEQSFQYLRFYTKKYWQLIPIAFLGFSDEDRADLINSVSVNDVKAFKSLSQSLSFICLSDTATLKQAERVRGHNATALSKHDFLKLFHLSYNFSGEECLYDLNVSANYRIAKPLSNFNEDVDVESFSLDSEKPYSANLYTMTCSCQEFHNRGKIDYPIGDLRRLCKHLILLYKNSFGVYNVSPLAKCIFDDGYGLSRKFSQIRIASIPYDVIVNFDQELDWWNLYLPDKLGIYTKYSYLPVEKRFSYNQKPIGIVTQLRIELTALEKKFSNPNHITSNKSSSGCLLGIVVIAIVAFLLSLFF